MIFIEFIESSHYDNNLTIRKKGQLEMQETLSFLVENEKFHMNCAEKINNL